jgi:hypothetical protein
VKARLRIDQRGTVISVDACPSDDARRVKSLWDACCFDHNSDPRPLLDSGISGRGFDLLVEEKDEKLFIGILRGAGVPVERVIQA